MPEMVFIMETKFSVKRARVIATKARYKNYLVVDAVGRSGGLMLMWKQDLNVELLNFSIRHINIIILYAFGENKWLLTCFYGHLKVSRRRSAWELLKSFKADFLGGCVIGDYNEILYNDEKVGGSLRSESQMELFRQVLEHG